MHCKYTSDIWRVNRFHSSSWVKSKQMQFKGISFLEQLHFRFSWKNLTFMCACITSQTDKQGFDTFPWILMGKKMCVYIQVKMLSVPLKHDGDRFTSNSTEIMFWIWCSGFLSAILYYFTIADLPWYRNGTLLTLSICANFCLKKNTTVNLNVRFMYETVHMP